MFGLNEKAETATIYVPIPKGVDNNEMIILEGKGNCNEKCSLSFKYQASNCTVTNKGNYLSIGYEHNDSQVIYNNSNYKVEDVRLYSPSVNKFNGSRADAEMIVLHKNNRNEYLAVCVPIKKSNVKLIKLEDIPNSARV